jgi:hypothetical protein
MKNLDLALRAATGFALVALIAEPLAGCSGASSSLPSAPVSTTTAPMNASAADSIASAARPDGKKKKSSLLFVSDNENNKITVYNAASKSQHPAPLRTITSGVYTPNGITTDESGNLYVANYAANSVTIYAPNADSPKRTITGGLNGPWDVKVDGFGNVYVANDPLSGGTAYIAEYPSGSNSPSTTWYVPTQGMEFSGIALLNPTQQGETSIYALGYVENPSGGATGTGLSCYPGNGTCVSIGINFGQTGGVAVVHSPSASFSFEWLAVDQYIPGIDIYALGQPNSQLVTGGTPEFLTLDSTGKDLFVADRASGNVIEYSFPAGKQLNTFAGGAQVYGVATYPSGAYH